MSSSWLNLSSCCFSASLLVLSRDSLVRASAVMVTGAGATVPSHLDLLAWFDNSDHVPALLGISLDASAWLGE